MFNRDDNGIYMGFTINNGGKAVANQPQVYHTWLV